MNKHLGDTLIDYAWGLLTPQEQARADAHLRECAECRAELTQHQSLTSKLARTVPAMLPGAPPRVRTGWTQVAARLPRLRVRNSTAPRNLPGFVAVGLAMSTAVMILIAVMTQAWLIHPPITATAPYPTAHGTPVASATYTPERPTAVATPVVFLYPAPMQVPRPVTIMATAKP